MGTVDTEKLEQDPIKSSSPQQHKRILVIDDDPDIVFTLRVGLESDPTIQVFGYDNPVTALVEFKPKFYDLLLIDINMPLMDGFQLAQNLVRRDLNVRVCFMTSGEIICSKRSTSTQEYRLFHKEANYFRTVVRTY